MRIILPMEPCLLLLCLLGLTLFEGVLSLPSVMYSNDFAVELMQDQNNASQVALSNGFYIQSKLDHMNVYHFVHPDVPQKSASSANFHLKKLQADPRVKRVFQQEHLIRSKRNGPVIHDKQQELPNSLISDNSIYQRMVPSHIHTKQVVTHGFHLKFQDPYFVDQWYLKNLGQTGGRVGLDLNVEPAWQKNLTGSGVVLCILDDGIDHTHPDLSDNFDPAASIDLNDENEDQDPMPDITNPNNGHGTRCAGAVVARANNSVCGVGVAYQAKIGGVRMLDGTITDLLESKALFFKPNYISIYSASWGPIDDGATMEAPKLLARTALQQGVTKGRNGLGVIYVWATGNGGLTFDDCNADGYVSSVETLAVGSVSNQGKIPYFMEQCTSTLAVVPTGGSVDKPNEDLQNKKIQVVTTGLHGKCVENFEGTSGAAPLAAGCIALVLQANPWLTWRDVQHLVVHSARIPSSEKNWFRNGANFHVSHSFGFGVMDCSRMVELAQQWRNVPPQRKCVYTSADLNRRVSFTEPIKIQIFCDGCADLPSSHLTHLEHVQVYVELNHSCRGDLGISLTSPAGTKSRILAPRKLDRLQDIRFTFLTVHNWMENPNGQWTLEIQDVKDNQKDGILLKWTLVLYGYELKNSSKNSKYRKMDLKEVNETIQREFSRKVRIRKFENPALKDKRFMAPDFGQNSWRQFLRNVRPSLTKNRLAENPRSISNSQNEPMFYLTEKIVKNPPESKLSEEFDPKSLGKKIAAEYSQNGRMKAPKIGASLQNSDLLKDRMKSSKSVLKNPLAAKFKTLLKKADKWQSEFSELKKMMSLIDSSEKDRKNLENLEANLFERNLNSLPKSSIQSPRQTLEPNSYKNSKISVVSPDVFAESMFLPSFDVRSQKNEITKLEGHPLNPGRYNVTRSKHNIFRKLLQNLRFYLFGSSKDDKKNPAVQKRRERLRNSLSQNPFVLSENSELLHTISKQLENQDLKTKESEDLEAELNVAKENQKLLDEFKFYPRSVKKQIP